MRALGVTSPPPQPRRRAMSDGLTALSLRCIAAEDRIITLEGHREQWRRIAYRYRDALDAIEGGHVCDEGKAR